MPYSSDSQRKFFHTDTAKRSGIKPSTVKEFDESSKGLKLPSHVSHNNDDLPATGKHFEKLKAKLRKIGKVKE